MKNFIESGDTFYVTLTADADPGDIIVVGELVGILVNGGVTGDQVAAKRRGVFWHSKVNGAISQGDKLYLKAGEGVLTKTATGNILVGFAFADAAAADPDVLLLLKC